MQVVGITVYSEPGKPYIKEIRHDNLLPCPFCGYKSPRAGVESAFAYHVKCGICGARTKPVNLPDTWDRRRGCLEDHLIKEAVKAWNSRSLPENYDCRDCDLVKAAQGLIHQLWRCAPAGLIDRSLQKSVKKWIAAATPEGYTPIPPDGIIKIGSPKKKK